MSAKDPGSIAIDVAKLGAFAVALPGRIHAAAQAVEAAERQLARVLVLRATGHTLKNSALAVARMALARAQRDLEDLQRIQGALPALLAPAREPRAAESAAIAL